MLVRMKASWVVRWSTGSWFYMAGARVRRRIARLCEAARPCQVSGLLL